MVGEKKQEHINDEKEYRGNGLEGRWLESRGGSTSWTQAGLVEYDGKKTNIHQVTQNDTISDWLAPRQVTGVLPMRKLLLQFFIFCLR